MVERRKALLAYSMGLGKTYISLAAVEELMAQGEIHEPGIVLVSASTKYQWAAEIERFTGSKALVVGGTPKQREVIYEEFKNWCTTGVDYLIVTYTTVTNDYKHFLKLPRGFVIADECVALKSPRTKRSKTMKELFKRTPVKFGLSGTPIENGKPEELFSQMEFIDPKVLGSFFAFDRQFITRNRWGGVESYKNLKMLHRRSSSAVFHKSADDPDVGIEMPKEILKPPVVVDMDFATRKLYARIAKDISTDLQRVASTPGADFDLTSHYEGDPTALSAQDVLRGMLMSKITAARMLCNHPDLLRHSARLFEEEKGHSGSSYAAELFNEGFLDAPKKSAKLDALVEMADEALADPKAKLVIFSVYRGMLDLISDRLDYKSVVYHGGLKAEERQQRKVTFQTDPATRIFISSDAGGVGVDLPQANCLINYDLPWQAGALDQRNARPRRVSSEWDSIVIEQLIVRGSLEEWQLDMLVHKSAVSRAIIEGRGITKQGGVDTSINGLLSYLKPGFDSGTLS
jgi:SNF2 family DNA or RNA helicase